MCVMGIPASVSSVHVGHFPEYVGYVSIPMCVEWPRLLGLLRVPPSMLGKMYACGQ